MYLWHYKEWIETKNLKEPLIADDIVLLVDIKIMLQDLQRVKIKISETTFMIHLVPSENIIIDGCYVKSVEK